jgi:hypothetical protein
MYRLRFVAAIAVVSTLLCASTALAQVKASRGWFDFGVGGQTPAESTFNTEYKPIIFGEEARLNVAYTLGTATVIQVGGGAMFGKRLGAGVTFTNSNDGGEPAVLSAHIPHPFFFNAYGDDTDLTKENMSRTERSFHIHAMFVVMDNGKIRIRAFGGPSYIRMTQKVVEDFAISQSISGITNTITVGGSDTIESTDSVWGYHAGGDVTYFFAKTIGVGGFVRYVNGTAEIPDPIDPTAAHKKLKVGGVQYGASLSVKF